MTTTHPLAEISLRLLVATACLAVLIVVLAVLALLKELRHTDGTGTRRR